MKRAALFYTYFESPVGSLLLAGDQTSLHYLSFPGGHKAFGPASSWQRSDTHFDGAKKQLSEYFAGSRDRFDLPLTLNGTDFQKSLWRLLL
ncbi:MAG: cysteine methyltransferase, partial [Pseudomonadota bacterium]